VPEPRQPFRRDVPVPSKIPSFLQALQARTWTEQALCAKPPYDAWGWVVESGSQGLEHPGTVTKMIEVCRECPVRRECLEDALSEDAFTVQGVWGGTTRTERRAAQNAAARERSTPTREIVFQTGYRGEKTTSRHSPGGGTEWRTHPSVVAELVETFEATLDERIAWWRAKIAPFVALGRARAAATRAGMRLLMDPTTRLFRLERDGEVLAKDLTPEQALEHAEAAGFPKPDGSRGPVAATG
jgi:WhiB family redox-sensing transcriptional regulator